jgi:hypothetical protein
MQIRALSFQRLPHNWDKAGVDLALISASYPSIVGFSRIGLEELDKRV